MDSTEQNKIVLHRKDGMLILFIPSGQGLYHYTLQANKDIDSFWSIVSIVEEKIDRYTQQAITIPMQPVIRKTL